MAGDIDSQNHDNYERILAMSQSGAIEQAQSACRRFIKKYPYDPNYPVLLGSSLAATEPEEAVKLLRRALQLAPDFAKAHEELGVALQYLDRHKDAEEHLRKAIRLDRQSESAHYRLGQLLACLGRNDEADEVFEQAFSLSPQNRQLAEAGELFIAGRLREAEEITRKVARKNPDDINAIRLLAKIAVKATAYEDAEKLLRRILSKSPRFNDAMHDLAKVLKETDRINEAIEWLEKSAIVEPNNPYTFYMLAGNLAAASRTEEAIEKYQKALSLRPNQPGVLLGLGHVLKTVGRKAEGIQAYREAIEHKPTFGEAYWSLANLKTYRFADTEIEAMEEQLNNPQLSTDESVQFNFALGKAYEDRKQFEKAFSHYQHGNEQQRMEVYYDPVQTESMHDDIIDVFSREFLKESSGHGCADNSPIFIIGLPRSGSTLIEQILSSHPLVDGTSELPDLGRVATSIGGRGKGMTYPRGFRRLEKPEFGALGEMYIKRTRKYRHGAPYFTDKMPNNFPAVGLIHLILPNAKIINATRHPLDACLGCYKQHFAKGQTFTYDLAELGEFYLEYRRVMNHWHRVLPGKMLDVCYERVVSDQETETRRIIDYCGLPWDDQCLEFYNTKRSVRTASSEQVRQPIYSSSVSLWKNYQRQLEPLSEILETVVSEYESGLSS